MFITIRVADRTRVVPFGVVDLSAADRPITVICPGCQGHLFLPPETSLAEVCDRIDARNEYFHDDACRARYDQTAFVVYKLRGRYRRRLAWRQDPARAVWRSVAAALRAQER